MSTAKRAVESITYYINIINHNYQEEQVTANMLLFFAIGFAKLTVIFTPNLRFNLKKSIYALVNPSTGNIFATKFQIASHLFDDAYFSYHDALEYYGLAGMSLFLNILVTFIGFL